MPLIADGADIIVVDADVIAGDGVFCTISSFRNQDVKEDDPLHVLLDPFLAQFLVLLFLGRDQFHCSSKTSMISVNQ